jgi:hypothetical protein
MSDSNSSEQDGGFFRCPVQPEDSEATICIRRRKIPAKMQDRSIDGFSVLVEAKHVGKLRVGSQWVLKSGGEVTEVLAQWMFHSPDGRVQLGLRRLRDLTPQPKESWVPALFSYRKQSTNPGVLLAGLTMAIFLAFSLPGIGDRLGTSGRIQSGLKALCDVVGDGVGDVW